MFETIFREYPTVAYAVLVITALLVFVVLAGGIASLNLAMTTLASTQRMMERYSDSITTRDREIGLLIEENKRIRADSDPEAVPDTDNTVPATEPCDGEGDLCYDDIDSMAHPTQATLEAVKAAEKILGRGQGTWRNVKISIPPKKQQPAKCVCPDTVSANVVGFNGALAGTGDGYMTIDSLDGVIPYQQPQFLYADAKILVEPLQLCAPLNSNISRLRGWWVVMAGARGSAGVASAEVDPVVFLVTYETLCTRIIPFINNTLPASDSMIDDFISVGTSHVFELTYIDLIALESPVYDTLVPPQTTLLDEPEVELCESTLGDIVLGANLGAGSDGYTTLLPNVKS